VTPLARPARKFSYLELVQSLEYVRGMTTKALLILPAFTAACMDDVSYRQLPDPPTTPVAFAQLGGEGAIVATGGEQVVTLADPLAFGLQGHATPGYELVPYGNQWPNTSNPEYRIRALAAMSGTFEIATEHGIASGTVASADFDHLAIVPANYHLDGTSQYAIDVQRPEIQIALFDESGKRLVDGSLAITGGTQTAWDRATLAATSGAHAVGITADSMPEQQATVTLTSAVSHIERRVEGRRVCYHAYAGNIEVATAIPMVTHPDPTATNCEL
jgi:hypothetical protein